LRITDGAAKRRDLGKSSRGEKNLQDINEGNAKEYQFDFAQLRVLRGE
jgi:hypothetical protein